VLQSIAAPLFYWEIYQARCHPLKPRHASLSRYAKRASATKPF
jgi:hypothetical protein